MPPLDLVLFSGRRFLALAGLGSRLDCFLSAAAFHSLDFDPASLGLLAFRQRHAQDAVVIFGRRALCGNSLRKSERPGKRAIRALDSMVAVSLIRLLKCSLTTQSDHVVFDREVKVFLFHAGEFGFENDLILVLIDVDAGSPGATANTLVAERTG